MHTPAAVPHLILCLRALGVSEYIHVRAWMRQERTTDDSGDTHDDLHTEDHQTVSILDLHCNPPWIATDSSDDKLGLAGWLISGGLTYLICNICVESEWISRNEQLPQSTIKKLRIHTCT
jgi:hypothetical protein